MIALILAGGGGTRLWPISTDELPKQFIPLMDGKSLLELTIIRNLSLRKLSKIVISTNIRYKEIVSQVTDKFKNVEFSFIFEEYKKDNSLIIYLCSLLNKNQDIIICPCDHIISDLDYFGSIVSENLYSDKITLFGIKPVFPSTEYGYIEANGNKVISFHEKPDYKNAIRYVASQSYFWNSGFFVSNTNFLLEKYRQHSNHNADSLELVLSNSKIVGNKLFLSSEHTINLCQISFDFDIIEKLDLNDLIFINYTSDWKDVGSYKSFSEVNDRDSNHNFSNDILNSLFVNGNNNFSRVNNKPIIINNLNNVGVVDSDDVLYVFDKNLVNKEDLSYCANWLNNKKDITRRPWGHYDVLLAKNNYMVKKLVILPGHSISLQFHQFRTEHWVVVSGKGNLLINDTLRIVTSNDQILIKQGDIHKVSNISDSEDLIIIEIQYGEYLSEDDITRLEDDYGRV